MTKDTTGQWIVNAPGEELRFVDRRKVQTKIEGDKITIIGKIKDIKERFGDD